MTHTAQHEPGIADSERERWAAAFERVRAASEELCAPLAIEALARGRAELRRGALDRRVIDRLSTVAPLRLLPELFTDPLGERELDALARALDDTGATGAPVVAGAAP